MKTNHSNRDVALMVTVSTALLASSINNGSAEVVSSKIAFNALNAQEKFNQFIVSYAGPYSVDDLAQRLATDMNRAEAETGIPLSFVRTLATGAQLVATGRAVDRAEAAAIFRGFEKSDALKYIEPDITNYVSLVPNDQYLQTQWYLYPVQPTTDYRPGVDAGINIFLGWNYTIGTNVKIAVIDTGYLWHSDLGNQQHGSGQFVYRIPNPPPVIVEPAGYDFVSNTLFPGTNISYDQNDDLPRGRDDGAADPGTYTTTAPIQASNWHGIHVMGLAAAIYNNSSYMAGVAPGAKIVPIRAFGYGGAGLTSDIVDAIVWASGGAVQGVSYPGAHAEVINMSFAGAATCTSNSAYQIAINIARANGSVLVAAAGNGNPAPVDVQGISPAGCSGVITVGATTKSGKRASFSNYGTKVDVAAPGGGTVTLTEGGTVDYPIYSLLNAGATSPGWNSYGGKDGTSMSAPQVAGLAALILSINGNMTADQVETLIKAHTHLWGQGGLPASDPTRQIGTGLIDVAATLAAVP